MVFVTSTHIYGVVSHACPELGSLTTTTTTTVGHASKHSWFFSPPVEDKNPHMQVRLG